MGRRDLVNRVLRGITGVSMWLIGHISVLTAKKLL